MGVARFPQVSEYVHCILFTLRSTCTLTFIWQLNVLSAVTKSTVESESVNNYLLVKMIHLINSGKYSLCHWRLKCPYPSKNRLFGYNPRPQRMFCSTVSANFHFRELDKF